MDKNPDAIRGIEDNKKRMGVTELMLKCTSSQTLSSDHQFDLVFLDPPFDHEHSGLSQWLLDSGCLKRHGLYQESSLCRCNKKKFRKRSVF